MREGFGKISILKTVLAIFLTYHFLAVLILPMGSGLIIRETGQFFAPYANLLEINTTWQFFSPGPSPIFDLEYSFLEEVEHENGEIEVQESEPFLLPGKRRSFLYSDHYNRTLFSIRFLSGDQGRLESYLVPWLCRKNPSADQVLLRQNFTHVMNLEKARIHRDSQDFSEMQNSTSLPSTTYSCPERDDNV